MIRDYLIKTFNSMLTNVRDWLNNMISDKDIRKALNIDVAIDSDMLSALTLWSQMYRNKPSWKGKEDGYIKTLNLPAVISSKIAGNVTVEMVVKVSGSERAKFINDQVRKIVKDIQHIVEKGNALGGIVIKPFPKGNEIVFDYVMADQMYPVSFDANGHITGCVFVDRRKIKAYWYTRLEYHQMEAGNIYRVINAAFRSSLPDTLGGSIPLKEVDDWKDLRDQVTIADVQAPLYGYFKVPIANTIDPSSPLGVSCFSRATDLIEQADRQWSDFLWEFESGKRAMYVDPTAMANDDDGSPFLANKRLYRKIVGNATIGDKNRLFDEWSPTLREQSLLNGLDAILKRIELNVGLAFGSLVTDPSKVEMTATEIKASRQETFLTITNTQKNVQEAIEQTVYAIDAYATLYGLSPDGAYEATYEFDDSIVSDHDTQFQQDFQVSSAGKMPDYIFLMRNYGLTKAEAKKWVAEKQQESADAISLLDEGSTSAEEE